MAQKKRTPKTSQGIHGGGGKTVLTGLQQVLLGKGAYERFKPVGADRTTQGR